ncbi:MAG: protease complex subunit PrcB family protein [Bacillota bacterium]
MFKQRWLFLLLPLMFLLVMGCGEKVPAEPVNGQEGNGEEVEVVSPDQLPAEIEEWIEDSRQDFAGQIYELEGVLYILVTYGEKPTGGYDVEITEIVLQDEKVVVTAEFIEPAEDEMVTQALTYPYDLAMIEDPGLPVEFIATGAETEIPAR